MRICHITTVHAQKDARIFYRMCRPLAERGLTVILVAPWSAEDPIVETSSWNEQIAGARRVKRIILALRAALAAKANIYHFHDPELISLGIVLKCLRPRAAVVYDVHEDYPAMMLVKYWVPKPLRALVSWAAYMANAVAGLFLNGIVTADPSVQKDFRGVAANKAIVYYNFPILQFFSPPKDEEINAKVDLVYVGGMSDRAGTFILLDAFALLAKKGIKPTVRLAGYTDGEKGLAAIQETIRNHGLTQQVELVGRIPYSHVPAFIRSGRVGLVTLQPIAKFMKNIPTKMFEYWACGLPVIASDLPPIRLFLANGKNGLSFNPSSARDLARVIEKLLASPAQCQAMGRYGNEQVSTDWNNDRQIDSLVSFYERIGSSSPYVAASSETTAV
jgi:glycosyltransferase involved in cell wall biosynthesis